MNPAIIPATAAATFFACVLIWAVRSLPDPASVQVVVPTAQPETPDTINVVLQVPTATSTPIPTVAPTPVTPTINDCGSPEPGRTCRKPQATLAPPTPLTSCERLAELKPGEWCVWSTEAAA